MSRIFLYARVSTAEQETQNQVEEARRRGYDIPDHRVVEENISGSVAAMNRPGFAALVTHKLEPGDQLLVLKVDRLGRDAADILTTVTMLKEKGVKVVSLDLCSSDLNSPEGRMMMTLLGAFAEFERSRNIERTQEGLRRAKAAGVKFGRKPGGVFNEEIKRLRAAGMTQKKIAAELNCSLSTVKRWWDGERKDR